jgi:sporulation protein YlmC with PRC-barrel domain
MTTDTAPDTALTIGSKVYCTDGEAGVLKRTIFNPLTRELTHLVVEPHPAGGVGHLVPIEYLAGAGADEIKLTCPTEELATFESAEETKFLPATPLDFGHQSGDSLMWPYFGLTIGGSRLGGSDSSHHLIAYDRVPLGEVSIRRGERVYASDGAVGHVQGLVIHKENHHVTHVLLDEGHLWGKKRVAIPIGAITHVTDKVEASMTKDEIRDLPEIDIDDFDSPA